MSKFTASETFSQFREILVPDVHNPPRICGRYNSSFIFFDIDSLVKTIELTWKRWYETGMRSSDSPALAGCVERRSQGRYPVTLELEYRGTGSEECFPGKTTDITSSGVRFSCEDRTFPIGATVELRIKWPTPPAETRQLELVVEGQVVRSHDGETALHTTRYRFGMRQMTAIRASRIGLAAG